MESFKECTFINLLRMLFCAVVGFAVITLKNGISGMALDVSALPVYIFAGITMSVFCVCWMYAYRTEAYTFLSVFTMLGTVLTCFLDAVIYKNPVKPIQWLGIAVLVAAVFIMSVYNKGIKGKFSVKGILILVIGSTGASLADFSQKIYVREIGKSADTFNFYMYVFGFVLLAAVFLLASLPQKVPRIRPLLHDRRHILIYFTIAFFLYINSVSKTMAARTVPSEQLYPVLQGANLIASAIMAHILFKEKINTKSICGMVTAFAGLMLLHFA